jgi:hypothetical protein
MPCPKDEQPARIKVIPQWREPMKSFLIVLASPDQVRRPDQADG